MLLLLVAAILLQVLSLMENEMILLQEGFAAFGADMGAERATAVWMTLVVQHQSVLGDEALATELTEMRFRFLLRWGRDLNDRRLLLLLLLCHLNCLLLDDLLLYLRSLLLVLILLRLVDLDLLMLLRGMRRTL